MCTSLPNPHANKAIDHAVTVPVDAFRVRIHFELGCDSQLEETGASSLSECPSEIIGTYLGWLPSSAIHTAIATHYF